MVETPLFNKAWQEARVRIFRLEALHEYNSPREKISVEKWKDGDKNFAEYGQWFQMLEKTAEKGIAIHKVRVVGIPLQEYLKYEIDVLKVSRTHGQQALFLEKEKYDKIIQDLGLKQEDFWIFDDKLVIVFHYNEKGGLAEEELVTDKSLVEKYVELKRALLENSFSMTPFLYKLKHFDDKI